HLPIKLPEVEKYLPTEDGQPPLGNATVWAWNIETNEVVSSSAVENKTIFPLELNTMPGWAGSSWYWMRYMDAHNENEFASKEALDYWQNVDLYIGGSEHATGHLLYSRFWNKFLKDKGFAPMEEPFKKLINQGMILGNSAYFTINNYEISIPEILKNSNFKIRIIKREYPISQKCQQNYQELIFDDIKKALMVQPEYYEDFDEFCNDLLDCFVNVNEKYFYWFVEFEMKIDNYQVISETMFIGKQKFLLKSNDVFPFEVHDLGKILNKLNELGFNISNILTETIKIKKIEKLEEGIGIANNISQRPFPVPINLINDTTGELYIDRFVKEVKGFEKEFFIKSDDDKFYCYREIEKMSKSKYNVVNPDDICNEYGADTLRLYEMFLGPLEQAKPWNTAGITGVFGFLKKLWRLYFDDNGLIVTNNEPSKENLKSLHKTIKKVTEDIEDFSFNTSVSQFMICVNELQTQNCHDSAILEPLAILISPYAPHIAEELWFRLKDSKIEELKDYKGISEEAFPIYDEKYLVESDKEYPVSFNGKMRFTISLPLDLTPAQIEEIIMKDERTIKQLDGNMPKKIIIVTGKVINLVG
ncbi:class I tRNA ligase family protein, partial [Flavobacterium sp.]|uniref:class I tRNA ligase family protein n=1 Tax=Flavobacterium sp. TaxID=239 RepID=UPI00286B0FD4